MDGGARVGLDVAVAAMTDDAPSEGMQRVSIVVSRFPKFTETFVVNEALALQRLGVDVVVHPLLRAEPPPHQPAAVPLVARARFGNPWGIRSLGALVRVAASQPKVVAGIIGVLVRRTWRRPAVLGKHLALLPRICAIALDVRDLHIGHVHAHFAVNAGFAAFCIGRLTGVPYSIVAHGSDVHKHQLMLGEKVAEAAFVATVSQYNREVIRSACDAADADRIEVVRVGVDLTGLPEIAGDGADGLVGDASEAVPLVLCVGTLHEVKGQSHLVAAIAELDRRGRKVRAELIGDGVDRSSLRSQIEELGVSHLVQLMGAMPHEQVLAQYRRAAVVVAPSVPSSDGRKEGIPTVLIEAMAAGVDVVASDLAGISELVQHDRTGSLVPPGDPVAIADAIEASLDDATAAGRRRAAAQELVRTEYDIDVTSARILALITGQGGTR